jgi:hypothetical protein
LAAGLALTAAFLIVWLNVAAGLIGIEDDDPANLLYVGVLAIGFGTRSPVTLSAQSSEETRNGRTCDLHRQGFHEADV